MHNRVIQHEFHSALGKWISAFIAEGQACGYRYVTESYRLRRFDRFLIEKKLAVEELPRQLTRQWMAKRPDENANTQRNRIRLLRQFALFLVRHEIPADVPDSTLIVTRNHFTPWIFRREEVRKLLQAADGLPRDGRSPWRHYIMPEVFRLLYGCGLRLGEVLRLTGEDVNLETGILTIRKSKFDKDRLVPMAPTQTARLKHYVNRIGGRPNEAMFFPAPDGGCYGHTAVYQAYRQLLRVAGISHGGRGKGPRIHDLRATFAVHRLEAWYREGADFGAKLPVLAAYMGHASFYGTQRYLRLTADLFPDVVERLDERYGHMIPKGVEK